MGRFRGFFNRSPSLSTSRTPVCSPCHIRPRHILSHHRSRLHIKISESARLLSDPTCSARLSNPSPRERKTPHSHTACGGYRSGVATKESVSPDVTTTSTAASSNAFVSYGKSGISRDNNPRLMRRKASLGCRILPVSDT